jgi:O-antigen/teichoic acid export membrane protein
MMGVLGKIRELLRLKAFDQETAEGRSKERHRRFLLTAAGSGVAQVIPLLTGLIMVPLTARYLGLERYGLWMTLSSMIAYLALADFGVGNGLLTALALSHGKEDVAGGSRLVSSAFFLLSGEACLLAAGFVVLYPSVSWSGIFKVQSPLAASEAGPAVAAFAICFAASLPASVVQRVQSGYQEGYRSNLWTAAGNLLALVSLLICIQAHAGLIWLVLALAGSPVIALAANGLSYFLRTRPRLRPRWHSVDGGTMRKLLAAGGLFFVLQACGAVAFNSDNLILVRALGPQAVASFAVASKLFMLVPGLTGILLAPLWPAYGEAAVRRDHAWIRRTLLRSLAAASLLPGAVSLVLVFFGQQIVHVWAGKAFDVPVSLRWCFAVWSVFFSSGTALAFFLNGVGALRFQALCAVCMTVAALALKLMLVGRHGASGVVLASVIAYGVCVVLPAMIFVPRFLAALGDGLLAEGRN